MRLARRLLRDTVEVTRLAGTGPYGDVWEPTVELLASVQRAQVLMPDGSAADTDATNTLVVWLTPDAELADGSGTWDATQLTPDARVMLAGEPRRLRSVQVHTVRGNPVVVELRTG